MSESEPKSPCISICVLDENDVCQGCYRTTSEITDWTMSGADEKRAILRRANQRMVESNPIQLN